MLTAMDSSLCFSVSFLLLIQVGPLAADFGPDYVVAEMTHMVDENTIYWPGNPALSLSVAFNGEFYGPGSWVEAKKFYSAEHGGTHLDAPYHFYQFGAKVADIPLNNLICKAVVINISSRASTDRDTRVTVNDILDWEKKYGVIPYGALVIMNSGWYKKYPNRLDIFSTADNDTRKFHFPGFDPVAVDWLLQNRPTINGIAVDTPSTDYGQSTDFQTHRKLALAGKYGLENVANLDAIPASGATVYALPYKMTNGTGAPVHMIASWPKDTTRLEYPSSYVDLTHTFSRNSLYYDFYSSFVSTVIRADSSTGSWYASSAFDAPEHGGTHLDAPRHYSKTGFFVGDIPVDRLIGPAVVIDITARAATNRQAALEVDDLLAWEARHGRIPNGAIVLMKSGWTTKYPNRLDVFGTAGGNSSLFTFPGFSGAASNWILSNRPNISAIGVDTPSLDASPYLALVPAHRNLLPAGIYGLENVANLHLLPESGAAVVVLAYRLGKGTGAPAYVVGKIPYVLGSASHLGSVPWLHLLILIQAFLLPRLL